VEDKLNIKILIIGGSGFIGSHLVKKCYSLGWKVTSLSLIKNKNKKKFKKIKYIYANCSDLELLKKSIKFDFDYVVNLGGYIDHRETPKIRKKVLLDHFETTLNLTSLRTKKLKKYLHVGTGDEYGNNKSPLKENYPDDPKSTYALAKSLSSKHLLMLFKKEKFPATILRLFLVYGPNQKKDRLLPYVINNSLKNKPIHLTHGKQLRDFCYIDDVVEAIILCLKNKKSSGQIFNIGSGNPITIIQIVKKIIKITNKGKLKINSLKVKKIENIKLYPSIKKIRKLIGWKPKVKLDYGLIKTVNFFKYNKNI
jgi:nucleoside-diphosphate-sugar epimerase